MKYTSFVFISLLYLLTTCTDETKPMSTPTPGTIASSDFQIYVDRFVSEAAKRGIKIDISRLNVVYSDTLKFYCGYGVSSTRTVQISNRPGCWSEQTDFNKEILLFHEMGHAILLRNHDNTKLPNGDFKTMMFGGNQFSLYSEDTPERRKYYLDELFNCDTLVTAKTDSKGFVKFNNLPAEYLGITAIKKELFGNITSFPDFIT